MSHAPKRARREKVKTPTKGGDDMLANLQSEVATPSASTKTRSPTRVHIPDDDSDDLDALDSKRDTVKASRASAMPYATPASEHELEDAAGRMPPGDLTDETSRALVAEGDQLSGDALRKFLQKNFIDFIDEKMLDFGDISEDL